MPISKKLFNDIEHKFFELVRYYTEMKQFCKEINYGTRLPYHIDDERIQNYRNILQEMEDEDSYEEHKNRLALSGIDINEENEHFLEYLNNDVVSIKKKLAHWRKKYVEKGYI